MEEEKTVGLVETFDTGELSTELIPPNLRIRMICLKS